MSLYVVLVMHAQQGSTRLHLVHLRTLVTTSRFYSVRVTKGALFEVESVDTWVGARELSCSCLVTHQK